MDKGIRRETLHRLYEIIDKLTQEELVLLRDYVVRSIEVNKFARTLGVSKSSKASTEGKYDPDKKELDFGSYSPEQADALRKAFIDRINNGGPIATLGINSLEQYKQFFHDVLGIDL